MIKYADRVRETSTSTGTGTINLSGAPAGYQTFVGGVGGGSKVPYAIFDGANWEIGRGTVTAGSPDLLARDSVLSSSNSNNHVNWGPGERNVILPTSNLFAVWRDENLNYIGDFGAAGGTGNAHTLTFTPQRLGLSDGMIITWIAPANNTTGVTVNIDGLGAVSYVDVNGSAFPAGTVKAGDVQQAVYSLGNNKLFSTSPRAVALRADQTATLTAGYTATAYNAGTKSSDTFTPDPKLGNFQRAINGGAHTLAPPSEDCCILIQYTNNGSAGAITTTGFTRINGENLSTANGDDFLLTITVINGFSRLVVEALQ